MQCYLFGIIAGHERTNQLLVNSGQKWILKWRILYFDAQLCSTEKCAYSTRWWLKCSWVGYMYTGSVLRCQHPIGAIHWPAVMAGPHAVARPGQGFLSSSILGGGYSWSAARLISNTTLDDDCPTPPPPPPDIRPDALTPHLLQYLLLSIDSVGVDQDYCRFSLAQTTGCWLLPLATAKADTVEIICTSKRLPSYPLR